MTDRFAGTPDTAVRGSTITIKFSNPDLANQTITVTIIDDEGSGTSVEITLDNKGNGSTEWTVPADFGDFAALQHSTSDDHTIAITDAGPAAARRKTPAKKAAKKAGTQRAAKSKSRRR